MFSWVMLAAACLAGCHASPAATIMPNRPVIYQVPGNQHQRHNPPPPLTPKAAQTLDQIERDQQELQRVLREPAPEPTDRP